jgi:hypothetical protein
MPGRGKTTMTAASAAGYRPGLVDLGNGQISREIFVNDQIYLAPGWRR